MYINQVTNTTKPRKLKMQALSLSLSVYNVVNYKPIYYPNLPQKLLWAS